MDIGAFSDENFDVTEWVNNTFKSAEAQEKRDVFVSSLIMKLQLYVQQVNSALEDTSQQVLQSLPRVMREAEALRQEAMVLSQKMQTVKQEIAKVEQTTGQSMTTLEQLDKVKTDLQMAKQALHETDNWTILANDLEEVFESGDVEQISAKLASMQQSLQILVSVPDYEDRRLQLEGLKNRLEAIASPLLVQAFTSGSVERSRVFVRVFAAMDRLPQLLKYYHKCQKGVLLQQWRGLVEGEEEGGVEQWLGHYYDILLNTWREQARWCAQVFPEPPHGALLRMLAEALTDADPPLSTCVDIAIKQQAEPLAFLLGLHRLTKQFAATLQGTVESASATSEQEAIEIVARAVHGLYAPYIERYTSLETSLLSQQLGALGGEDLAELGRSVPRAADLLLEARDHCVQLSEGCAFPGLVQACNSALAGYVERFAAALRRMERGREVEGQEDWAAFRVCLALLHGAGELLSEVSQLDLELRQSLLDSCRRLDSQDSSPWTRYRSTLLSVEGRRELSVLEARARDTPVGETVLLTSVSLPLRKLCADLHQATHAVVFGPIAAQLAAWAPAEQPALAVAPDLPDYSFAPQEYITQIGQYLMTLPQHLEPLLTQDDPMLTRALRTADPDAEGGLADALLAGVARSTCQAWLERLLGTYHLPQTACRQLAVDIGYLGDVLGDLGRSLSEQLAQVAILLRLTPEEYVTGSAGCAPKLVAAVRQMRDIPSSS